MWQRGPKPPRFSYGTRIGQIFTLPKSEVPFRLLTLIYPFESLNRVASKGPIAITAIFPPVLARDIVPVVVASEVILNFIRAHADPRPT